MDKKKDAFIIKLLAETKETKKKFNAVVSLRKSFKEKRLRPNDLLHYSAIPTILKLLDDQNQKVVDATLSLLGNICTDSKIRVQVFQHDGILKLGEMLSKSEEEDIQNRTSRTIANLAQDAQICSAIHDEETVVLRMTHLLKHTEDANCRQTYIRALRLLSDSTSHTNKVLEAYGLREIAKCLKVPEWEVQLQALRTTSHFVHQKITEEHVRQLSASDAFTNVVDLTANSNKSLSNESMSLLLYCTSLDKLRPLVGNGGGLDLFLGKIKEESLSINKRLPFIDCLCMCCQEVVNRNKIRENEGLAVLIKFLKQADYDVIHARIISAFVCFLYDDTAIDMLLKGELIELLIKKLHQCAGLKGTYQTSSLFHQIADDLNTASQMAKLNNCNIVSPARESATASELPIVLVEQADENTTYTDGENYSTNIKGYEIVDSIENEGHAVSEQDKPVNEGENKESGVSAGMSDKTVEPELPRYSMDSPTYKEVAEWKPDTDNWHHGPKNILDTDWYQTGRVSSPRSPDRWSSGSSPSHVHSYSPFSVASSYVSPNWSRGSSPNIGGFPEGMSSPEQSWTFSDQGMSISPGHSNVSGLSPGPYTGLSDCESTSIGAHSPIFSPVPSLIESTDFDFSDLPPLDTNINFTLSSPLKNSDNLLAEMTDNTICYSPKEETHPDETAIAGTSATFQTDCDDSQNAVKETKKRSRSVSENESVILGLSATKKRLKLEMIDDNNDEVMDVTPNTSRHDADDKTECETKQCKVLFSPVKEDNQTPTSTHNPHPKKKDRNQITVYNILLLLSRILYLEDPKHLLENALTLEVILDYVLQQSNDAEPRARRILLRMIQNPLCFDGLICRMFPAILELKHLEFVEIHNSESDDCCHVSSTCEELMDALTTAAVGSYGQGVVSHTLRSVRRHEHRDHCLMLVPLIYRDADLLLKMCPDMTKVLDVCLNGLHSISDNNASPLSILSASNLHMLARSFRLGSTTYPCPAKKTATQTQVDIKFVMDDGTKVFSSKELIIHHSTVFASMFQGSFSEATKQEISLPNHDAQSFKILVNSLNGQYNTEQMYHEINMTSSPFKVALNLLSMADQYMLESLHWLICQVIKKYFLSKSTCSEVFMKASFHNSPWLAEQSLCVVLGVAKGHTNGVSDKLETHKKLVSMFNTFVVSEVTQDIRNVLLKAVSLYTCNK